MSDTFNRSTYNPGVNFPIEASSTFEVRDAESLSKLFMGEGIEGSQTGYVYSRHFNPTVLELGRKMAELEKSEAAYCTSSGMSAIATSVLALCNHGDHIIANHALYGGTHALFANLFHKKFGIHITFVNISNFDEVQNAIQENTKLIYTETVANPTLLVSDIEELSKITHRNNLKLIVDNTFAPHFVFPLSLGADCVIHSLTKYISGESDLVAGAICGSQEFIAMLMDLNMGPLMLLGPTLDPSVASRLINRLPHLGLRLQEQNNRAKIYAQSLEKLGFKVIYPGLKSHPQHDFCTQLFKENFGYGSVISLDLGTLKQAYQFSNLLSKHGFARIAVSLGYYDTLVSCPSATTHSELSEEHLDNAEITQGLVRLSIGYTGDLNDRLKQLENAVEEYVEDYKHHPIQAP